MKLVVKWIKTDNLYAIFMDFYKIHVQSEKVWGLIITFELW